MPEGTVPFMQDRMMSLHRRAYDLGRDEWADLAQRLGVPAGAVDTIWMTAKKAKNAGMSKELAFPLLGEIDRHKMAESMVSVLLGETVVTNDRTLNYVLQQAGNIIGKRDVAPIDKIETLYAYILKARREVLGAVDV
jgi:hypothetical protein